MVPEVRREFELLQVENSDLLRKSNRAVELLRRVLPWATEWYDLEQETELDQADIGQAIWEAESFLRELEGK